MANYSLARFSFVGFQFHGEVIDNGLDLVPKYIFGPR